MAINQELRRRKGINAASPEQAADPAAPTTPAVEPGPGVEHLPAPKQVKTKEQLKAERARVKALKAEQARIKADADAQRLPPPVPDYDDLPPINGRTLSLHELNLRSKAAARHLRNENREVVAAVAKATADTLSSVVDRRRHSRAQKAADLARDLKRAADARASDTPKKGEGFVPLYGSRN